MTKSNGKRPECTLIIGQGYVGLPLAQGAAKAGIRVVGLDLNSKTVANLNKGISHVDDLTNSDVAEMVGIGYEATTDVSRIAEATTIVICVPTPLGEAGSPDLGPVRHATKSIAENMRSGTLVVLESTTYPGTTEDILKAEFEKKGFVLDSDFFLAFSPERIDPGNKVYGLKNTPKVVGGVSPASTNRAVSFYEKFVDTVVPTRGAKEAETAKLLENTYRHVNIALVNEMVKFCHELDIDLWDVIKAASTKPFGFQAFYPGPGVGGHCIPIDPNYLSYEVERSLGYPFRFVELAQEINSSMPRYVVQRVQDALNDDSRSIRNSHILILGVTYKANIADQRESPAQPVAELLLEKGAKVMFHDPRVERWNLDTMSLERVEDLRLAVCKADIVVLLQGHEEYSVDELADVSKIFFDTRGTATTENALRL